MKRVTHVVGGLLFLCMVVGTSLAGASLVDADAPYLATCGGDEIYYIRNAVVENGVPVRGDRYIIPREDIRATWGVANVPVYHVDIDVLNVLPLRGTLAYGPGTLVKVPDDYKVYVVTRGRVLRYIDAPSTAAKHFGRDWESKIKYIPSSWLPSYRFGQPILASTWLSDKETEVSFMALFEATSPVWKENAAVLRDRERLGAIQGTIIPFLYETMRVKGQPAPFVQGKWLLGTRGAGWVYGTDTVNNAFRQVPVGACKDLKDGTCIKPAPDAQINTDLCGTQVPYGYQNALGGFEISFCVETAEVSWQPRADDFDDIAEPLPLRQGWYKYTVRGLERISL